MALFSFALLALSYFTNLAAGQQPEPVEDPVLGFCRRFGHQTTVVGNNLYIDGGLVNWNSLSQYPDNYTSK